MENLDEKTIQWLTSLSRIQCSKEEQASLLKDLESILGYMTLLNEIDTSDTPPCNYILEDVTNVLREDTPLNTLSREKFLSNAPSQTGGLIRVPPVIKKS